MNADMSAAPEIALLAAVAPPRPRQDAAPRTIAGLARELRVLGRHPERWWDAVRFDHGRCVIAELGVPGTWLSVLPPGGPGIGCGCTVLMVVAGEVTEESLAADGGVISVLRPGAVRVHGEGHLHQLRSDGPGFAVCLHAGAAGSAGRRT